MKGAIFSDSRAKSLHSEMLHDRRSCAEERYNTPRLFRRTLADLQTGYECLRQMPSDLCARHQPHPVTPIVSQNG
jgi:hypothetical protein